MPDSFSIVRATIDDIDHVASLFDGYRQFYGQPPDPTGAAAFIRDRVELEESVIFLSLRHVNEQVVAAGFTQLYSIFSSVSMVRVWLLNDLFVHPDHRRCGVARALMICAIEHARKTGYTRVSLATDDDNVQAQALYENLGFVRERGFRHYELSV